MVVRFEARGFAVALLMSAAASPSNAQEQVLLGFSKASAAIERNLEGRFDAALSAEDQRAWVKQMAAKANAVGSPHDLANATWMLRQFKRWGWDAHIERFDVLFPTPIAETLELLGDHPFRARLHEPPVEGDPTSRETADVLPPYLAYQGDGDVTAEVVYVNNGLPEDYDALASKGVSVKGRIVIARYDSNAWRGLKPYLAQEHGAIGCLIYSDPADDGYGTDDPYPIGSARPADGVQRGSVARIMLYAGDPLTQGVAATPSAKRLARADAASILTIPALPISYADALPILHALGGPIAPKAFRGQLQITYRLGPSIAPVHLQVLSDWSLKPVYDVIAEIKGSELPDQWVIRANHHDGWVFGAWDPLAGNAALLDEAKSLGALVKAGWRPKRTLIYASWDGEEPGMLGSTEWAEAHAEALKKKAVVYINSDTNARGFLGVEASPDLDRYINQVAADVRDPETQASVQSRLRSAIEVRGLTDPKLAGAAQLAGMGGDVPIAPLGAGSDYIAFLSHLGIASVNIGFGGEGSQDGIYHSVYDTYAYFSRFGDPTFAYGVSLAKVGGRLALRQADADVLPLRFGDLAFGIGLAIDELKALNAKEKADGARLNRLIASGAFALASDPKDTTYPPAITPPVPDLDFSALDAAIKRLAASAKAYDALLANGLPPRNEHALNAVLQSIDQRLLDPDGLPGRPWVKNLTYAPGMLTGYGVKTLPGVREAIEGGRWPEAQVYVAKTAKAVDEVAGRIDMAAALWTAP